MGWLCYSLFLPTTEFVSFSATDRESGIQSVQQNEKIHSHIETPHGVRRLNAGGIWQFRPETMKLEVFARGFVNPWGHAFDDYGVSFATDGAGFSSREQVDLIKTNHVAFRPIDVKMGPDGAI